VGKRRQGGIKRLAAINFNYGNNCRRAVRGKFAAAVVAVASLAARLV